MRGVRGLFWGMAAAVALSVEASAAGAPALRRDAGEAEIEAWISEHVSTSPDEMRGITYDHAVEYYDPRSLEKQADGHVLVSFRQEHWTPQKEGRLTYRSQRQRVEIDCQGHRFRFLSVEAFSENNLQGRASPLPTNTDWSPALPEDDLDGQEVRQVCSFASLIGTPDWESGMPSPPRTSEAAAYEAWTAAHVKPGDDVLLQQSGSVAHYYSPADLEQTANSGVRAWIRQELPWPIVLNGSGVRSTRTHYEIDCAHGRYVTRDLIVFPGLNMTGTPYAEFPDDASLRGIRAGEPRAALLRALCRLAADRSLSPAEALRPPPVPAPVGPGDEALQAWIEEHLNTEGYAISSYDTVSVILYEPGSLALLPNGHLAVSIRREGLQPPEPGRGRSMLIDMQLDCSGRRSRVMTSAVYGEANLEGAPDYLEGFDWTRAEEDSHEALLMAEACPQRGLLAQEVDREAALTPPPVSDTDDDDIAAWMAEYVRPLGYVYAGRTGEAVGLFSWEEGERTRQDFVRVWTRIEYFQPQIAEKAVLRSMRQLVEYDCDQGRSRTLATEAYPGANLTGRPAIRRLSQAEWSFTSPGTLESGLADAVCDVRDRADEAGDVSAPRLPGQSGESPL
jgi:hypothetical protein